MKPKSEVFLAVLALTVSTMGWSLSPIFIRWLSAAYEPLTQSFVRYISSTVGLVVICLIFYRAEFLSAFRRPGAMMAVAAVNVAGQYVWTAGTYGTNATVSQLITKLSVLLVIILSFFLFREERATITHPGFLAGTFLSFAGLAAVLATEPGSLIPRVDWSSFLLLLTAVSWAVYTVWCKHLVFSIHPAPMFTVISLYTTVGLFALAAGFEDVGAALRADITTTAVAVTSGLLPIAAAHVCYHYAQKHLGAGFSGNSILLTPVITYVLAVPFLPGERLLPSQWIGGAALLVGAGLAIYAKRQAHIREIAARLGDLSGSGTSAK